MEKRSNQKRRKTTTTGATAPIRFRRQFNPLYKGGIGEINKLPSLTRPDMALTVKQLLDNHRRGIHSNINENEGNFFEMEIPQFDDITDEIAFKEELAENLKTIEATAREELQEKQKEKQAAKAAEKEANIVEAQKRIKDQQTKEKEPPQA